jgi:uncharacterized membrane protein
MSRAGLRRTANRLYFPAMQDHQPQDPMIHRLAAFADAVVAIVMTLLALDIRLPAPAGDLSDAELLQALIGIAPKYYAYGLSFIVAGLFWTVHARKLRQLARSDVGLVWLNIVFFMVLGLLPFVTSVLAENSGKVGTILYAAVVALISFTLAAISAYAAARKLFTEGAADATFRGLLAASMAGLVFLVSIPIAFYSADGAKYFWLLLIPAGLSRRLVRGEERAS